LKFWTNKEVRILTDAYENGYRTKSDLEALLPDHSIYSCRSMAYGLGLRCPSRGDQVRWLRLAHQYFARRESGLLA